MAPIFDDEIVFVGSYDGFIYRCDLNIKKEFCYSINSDEQQFGKGIRSTPLIYLNSIILATLSGWILSLNKVNLFLNKILKQIILKLILVNDY